MKKLKIILVISLLLNMVQCAVDSNTRLEHLQLKSDYHESQVMVEEIGDMYERLSTSYAELSTKYTKLSTENKEVVDKLHTVSRGSGLVKAKTLVVEATAYTWTGNRTYSGTVPKAGRTIAVDPKIIPVGSIVYVEGFGYRIAEDTGGSIKGNIIDIYMDSKEECIKWGRRKNLKVYVIK